MLCQLANLCTPASHCPPNWHVKVNYCTFKNSIIVSPMVKGANALNSCLLYIRKTMELCECLITINNVSVCSIQYTLYSTIVVGQFLGKPTNVFIVFQCFEWTTTPFLNTVSTHTHTKSPHESVHWSTLSPS